MKTTVSKRTLGNLATILVILGFFNLAQAQENAQRWAIDFSPLTQGLFSITQAKATYLLNPQSKFKSEIGLGFLYQPESTAKANEAFNNDGIYSAKMATIAYRQYFWKGLHLEEDFNFGQGAVSNNVIDGKTYKEFVIFTQSLLGYKCDVLKREKYTLFVMGQGGVGYAYNANHWPSYGSPTVYGLGDLKIGINF
jgi:hypothetical protein